MAAVAEKNLQQMEALLKHSTLGVHILFDNSSIANVMKQFNDDKDFLDHGKMKIVQDVLTQLVSKKTYIEKVSYISALDPESYALLVRSYFHIVENTVRQIHELKH